MARLNTHPSATPQPARSSTADSLYRDPSTAPHHAASTARHSSYSVISPSRSMNSDKENETPETRENTPRPLAKGKGKRMASGPARLPTPDSGSNTANKRRRTGDYVVGEPELYDDGDSDVRVYEDREEQNDQAEEDYGTPPENDEEEEEGTRYYNPRQNPETRRRLRAGMRNQHRELEDNRDDVITKKGALVDHVKRANRAFGKVRQTADAVLDSRFLVTASDLASKKLNKSLQGNTGVGIDVDQFVSKCIHFMKTGGDTTGAEEGAAIPDEDDTDDNDVLDWAFLGREACFPSNKRPPAPSFLLGPLSVQKRARTTQSRRARSQRQPLGPATRPQEIKESDIKQSENSNLTHIVKSINKQLREHIQKGEERVENELSQYGEDEEVQQEDIEAACRRYRVCSSPEDTLCVSLFDFVVNPQSFGQTVENIFYVSFLIREGNAKVMHDNNGLPLLIPSEPRKLSEQREQHVHKQQAVFSIDWPTWKALIEAFDIKSPLIPHRVPEETNVSAGGWYG